MWAAFRFPAPLKSWALFDTGPYISFGPFLDCPHFLLYYSVIPAIMTQSYWASFKLAVYSFLQWLSMAIGSPIYGLLCPFRVSLGHPWPICFLWASLALLLTLHFHGFLLTSLGFLGPITLFSSLGFMGLSLTPCFLYLHYFGPAVAYSYFSISYTAHGYAISLFSDSLKPTCLFKAHLFISWAYDPLFLPLGPNGFTWA